jgi:Ca-activated chloride channel family protein
MTDGRFYRVTDADTLDEVFKEIDHLEKSEIKSNEKVRYDENYQKPLKYGIFALIAEQLLKHVWWRIIL